MMVTLIVTRTRQLSGQGQGQRHGVVADRVHINAAGVGQTNSLGANGVLVKLVVTGAADLNELQIIRQRQQVVPPEPSGDQHVAFGDARTGFIRRPGLKMIDPRVPLIQHGGKLIRRVGEMNGDVIFVHGRSLG